MKSMTEKNDPARVIVGSKWRRNSLPERNGPARYVTILEVVPVSIGEESFTQVRYVDDETGRHSRMWLDTFIFKSKFLECEIDISNTSDDSSSTLTLTGLHEKVDRLTRMVERLLAREDQAPKGPA